MNSSTSSSRRSGLLAVSACLLLAGIALEAVSRLLLYPASLDFVRFASYPARARALAAQPGLRIALLGNSATEEGVDVDQVASQLRADGVGPVALDMFLADGSSITTWRSMLERYFWEPDLDPDLVVITYFESRLQDGSEDDLGRLAQFFAGPRDWPDLFRTDLRTLSTRVEFLLSSGSATYAARGRIKDRLLAFVIPGYKEFTFELNGAAVRHAHLANGASRSPRPEYRSLIRMLDRAQNKGTKICFIAFPMRPVAGEPPYPIDPELQRLIEDRNARFIDLRVMPEIGVADYRDPIHLLPAGKEKYTRRFSEILAHELKSRAEPEASREVSDSFTVGR